MNVPWWAFNVDLEARKTTQEPLPNVSDVTELNAQHAVKRSSKRSSLKVSEGSLEKLTVLNQILVFMTPLFQGPDAEMGRPSK